MICRMIRFIIAVVMLGAASVAAGCGGDDDEPAASMPTVNVTQHDFYFEPATQTVLGYLTISSEPVRQYAVHIRNSGNTAHTFTIAQLGIDEQLPPGEEQTVNVSGDSGVLTFFCRFHRDRGMTGTLQIAGSPTP
jgi:plastocyanin